MLSIFDDRFLEGVNAALAKRKQLFVWHLLSYTGGASDEYIINSFSEFIQLASKAKSRSRFDIYRWPGSFFQGVAVARVLEQSLELLETHSEITTYRLIPGELTEVKAWAKDDLDEIKEWFEENKNAEIAVGLERPIEGRIIVGYFPDADGIVRPGQY